MHGFLKFSFDSTATWHSKHALKRDLGEIKCTSSGDSNMLIDNTYLLLFVLYSESKALVQGEDREQLWVQSQPKPSFFFSFWIFLSTFFFSDHNCLSFCFDTQITVQHTVSRALIICITSCSIGMQGGCSLQLLFIPLSEQARGRYRSVLHLTYVGNTDAQMSHIYSYYGSFASCQLLSIELEFKFIDALQIVLYISQAGPVLWLPSCDVQKRSQVPHHTSASNIL